MPPKARAARKREVSSELSSPPSDAGVADTDSDSAPRGKKRKRGVTTSTPKKPVNGAKSGSTPSISSTQKSIADKSTNGEPLKRDRDVTATTPRRSRKQGHTDAADEDAAGADLTRPGIQSSKPRKRTRTGVPVDASITTTPASPSGPKPGRRAKAASDTTPMPPLAPRTISHAYRIGAHVSAAGGVHNAVEAATQIGCNAFALFLKSQRKWANPALADEVAERWVLACSERGYAASEAVVPHGSYLVNLAHTDEDRSRQAYGSFVDDLRRCERLGIGLYNFHPGSVQGVPRSRALGQLAKMLNRAHAETAGVVTLLENMAARGGNVIGAGFEELAEVIGMVDDKSRVGVCLDTCHAYAAGYDLSSERGVRGVLDELEGKVGLKYLRALHMNDSKAPLGSGRDLHANIGTGFIGLKGFHAIMNEDRLKGLPMVLETPIDVYDEEGVAVKDEKGKNNLEDKGIWAREIKLLESLSGMNAESDDFKALDASLAKKGQKERARIQGQVDRRDEKADKAKSKKGRKKKAAEEKNNTSDEDSS